MWGRAAWPLSRCPRCPSSTEGAGAGLQEVEDAFHGFSPPRIPIPTPVIVPEPQGGSQLSIPMPVPSPEDDLAGDMSRLGMDGGYQPEGSDVYGGGYGGDHGHGYEDGYGGGYEYYAGGEVWGGAYGGEGGYGHAPAGDMYGAAYEEGAEGEGDDGYASGWWEVVPLGPPSQLPACPTSTLRPPAATGEHKPLTLNTDL